MMFEEVMIQKGGTGDADDAGSQKKTMKGCKSQKAQRGTVKAEDAKSQPPKAA